MIAITTRIMTYRSNKKPTNPPNQSTNQASKQPTKPSNISWRGCVLWSWMSRSFHEDLFCPTNDLRGTLYMHGAFWMVRFMVVYGISWHGIFLANRFRCIIVIIAIPSVITVVSWLAESAFQKLISNLLCYLCSCSCCVIQCLLTDAQVLPKKHSVRICIAGLRLPNKALLSSNGQPVCSRISCIVHKQAIIRRESCKNDQWKLRRDYRCWVKNQVPPKAQVLGCSSYISVLNWTGWNFATPDDLSDSTSIWFDQFSVSMFPMPITHRICTCLHLHMDTKPALGQNPVSCFSQYKNNHRMSQNSLAAGVLTTISFSDHWWWPPPISPVHTSLFVTSTSLDICGVVIPPMYLLYTRGVLDKWCSLKPMSSHVK